MGNSLVVREGLEFVEWRTPPQGRMRSLAVVEAHPSLDGMLSGPRLAKRPGVEAFLVECAVDALDLAVLLRLGYRYELVADAVGSQSLFEGVGLLHMGEEDVGKLCAMVGLDLLEGKGEGSHKPS
jgi:hypothetical protein|tara:strand:- start:595 stop:969 length:375 start_codon:yes stop_codon:yes gene_type:complete